MHPRKTPEKLRGRRCECCTGTGGLSETRLVPEWELKKNHVPLSKSDPRNLAILCRMCQGALKAKVGHAPADGDTVAVLLRWSVAFEGLVERRKAFLAQAADGTLFGAFGIVQDKKEYRKKLERGFGK